MEFQLTPGTLVPYIVSNAIAVFALWLSVRKPGISKGLLGILFVCASVFNIYTAFSNPSAYQAFADTALVPFYEKFIRTFFADNAVIIISVISVGQLYIGLSMMYGDARFKAGCIGGIIFGVAIAPLGLGSALPCSLILSLSFLILLIVTNRDVKLNGPQGKTKML